MSKIFPFSMAWLR